MIPFVHVPDVELGFLTLHPFGLLVATGVLVGTWLATRRARQRGLDVDKLNSFITWMLVAGFLGGHMLDVVFYHPDKLVEKPWTLFLLYDGLSSFGGFVGALIGIILWKFFELRSGWFRRRKTTMPILPFADLILSVFPVAWVFGRSGCSSVHDHPGMKVPFGTPLSLACEIPCVRPERVETLLSTGSGNLELMWGRSGQYDLGLIEMMFTVVLASLIALTWHKKLPTGTYVVVTALAYAPVRFAMDFIRVTKPEGGDPRYGTLTPAQWACVALFVFGLVMAKRVRDIGRSGSDPLDLVALPRTAEDAVESPPAEEPA